MRKEFLAVKIFVKFGYNYYDPKEFIDYICKKCQKSYLKEHLLAKFNHIASLGGNSAGWVCTFFCDIDGDLQEALVDYAVNVWGVDGMYKTYEEYKSL